MKIYQGHCRCGKAQIQVDGQPLLTAACHCKGCQRMTSGAFSLSALYPDDRMRVIAGETILGGLKQATKHHFCANCLSWIYTRPAGLEGMVNIRTPLLEYASEFPPFVEFFRDEGLPGVESGAALTFGSAPQVNEFLKLKDAYAEWDHRPA